MTRRPAPLLAGCALAVLLAVGVADPALAADVKNAGKNIGDTMSSWAGSLFAGGTAVAACFYGLQRKVGPALVFAGLALLVGGFIFAPGEVSEASEDLWKTVLR
jgi:hypothetical protein